MMRKGNRRKRGGGHGSEPANEVGKKRRVRTDSEGEDEKEMVVEPPPEEPIPVEDDMKEDESKSLFQSHRDAAKARKAALLKAEMDSAGLTTLEFSETAGRHVGDEWDLERNLPGCVPSHTVPSSLTNGFTHDTELSSQCAEVLGASLQALQDKRDREGDGRGMRRLP